MCCVCGALVFFELMPRPVALPCFHPLPPPAPAHMGRRRRQRDWGRWEEDRQRGIARAHPVPVLRGWARAPTSAVSGARRWGKIVDAACVLYAVCKLFPGALDLTALLVGAFEYFISVGASRPAASVSFTGTGLAVAPGAVRAALRWRYGVGATHAWRAPRQHFLAGAMRQEVYNIILPLWDAGPLGLRGVRQWVPDQWWHLPQCRLVVLTGWCPGPLAGSAGHALGLSYTGWLACNQHGTVYVGQDPDAALELIRQWLPVVWEAWYFCIRPRLAYRRYLSFSVCMCFCLLADVSLDQTRFQIQPVEWYPGANVTNMSAVYEVWIKKTHKETWSPMLYALVLAMFWTVPGVLQSQSPVKIHVLGPNKLPWVSQKPGTRC